MHIAQGSRGKVLRQVGSEVFIQRGTVGGSPGEHPFLEDRAVERHEAVRGALEITHIGKIRGSLEPAVEGVSPAVIWTPELPGGAGSIRHDRCCMVTADVEETAQPVILSASDKDRLATRQFARNVIALRLQFLDPAGDLPRPGEDGVTLQVEDPRLGVPRRRDGMGPGERCISPIRVDDLIERQWHTQLIDLRRIVQRSVAAGRCLLAVPVIVVPELTFNFSDNHQSGDIEHQSLS